MFLCGLRHPQLDSIFRFQIDDCLEDIGKIIRTAITAVSV